MSDPRLLCIGTALIDSVIRGFDPHPISASGYRAESQTLHTGGEALNEAVVASRLDLSPAILCALGKDPAGQMIFDVLDRSGIDTSSVVCSDQMQTPISTLFVHEDGSRKSVTNRAHFYAFHPEDHLPPLEGFSAVSIASIGRVPFRDPEVVYAVAKRVHEAGLPLFADMKLPNQGPVLLSDYRDALPFIDFIFPNVDEAAYYSQKNTPADMAEIFLSYGVKNVIITLGAEGCYFKNQDFEIHLPACPVSAVDATGAGDAFVAGFMASLLASEAHGQRPLSQDDLRRILTFANVCGGLCSTAVGAGNGIESRSQVEQFLKDNRL